jgi:hypothetical protein
MRKLLGGLGYQTRILLRSKAKLQAVCEEILTAAHDVPPGGIFVLTYSGHGGQVVDSNGDEEEGEMDSTLCLYDGQLVDDKIAWLFSQFPADVRILFISDSCHSGTIYELADVRIGDHPDARTPSSAATNAIPSEVEEESYRSRAMPKATAALMQSRYGAAYAAEQRQLGTGDGPRATTSVAASVITLSACGDDQDALEGEANGLFTKALKQTWDGGTFPGGYEAFIEKICKLTPESQTPQLHKSGRPNAAFLGEKPFTIDAQSIVTPPRQTPAIVAGPNAP